MKLDQIFDYLLQDKNIRLLDSHKIPLAEDIRGIVWGQVQVSR